MFKEAVHTSRYDIQSMQVWTSPLETDLEGEAELLSIHWITVAVHGSGLLFNGPGSIAQCHLDGPEMHQGNEGGQSSILLS